MVATAAIKWQSAIGIHVHGQACVRCGASASALFPPFRTTFLPRGRCGGRVPVQVAGADWLSKREGAEQVIRSKHLSRESKQYYEHEQEYQKHVHLLTCLVYSRVKGYQQLNSPAPIIRVSTMYTTQGRSLSTRISIGMFRHSLWTTGICTLFCNGRVPF